MRQWMRRAAVGFALMGMAVPVTAASADASPSAASSGSGGWVPAPSAPFDRAAGVDCAFAIHAQPIVDEVRKRTLTTNPDGSPKSEAYVGRLVVRVTDTGTGAYDDVDAGGSAVISYGADGSQTWYVAGPVLAGFPAGLGNLPRGIYQLNGVYTLVISASAQRTFTPILHASADNICTHID